MDALGLSPWNPCLTSQLPCLQLPLGTQPVEHVKIPKLGTTLTQWRWQGPGSASALNQNMTRLCRRKHQGQGLMRSGAERHSALSVPFTRPVFRKLQTQG